MKSVEQRMSVILQKALGKVGVFQTALGRLVQAVAGVSLRTTLDVALLHPKKHPCDLCYILEST